MSTTEKAVTHTPGPWTVTEIGTIEDDSHNPVQIAGISPRNRDANARLIAAAPDLLKALEELECPECSHTLKHHADKYNCDVERGDSEGYEGEPAHAMGPCGCECLDVPDLLVCIAAIRKAKGEAL